MRIVLTIWMLLYFLVAALAATSRSLQSSTPRMQPSKGESTEKVQSLKVNVTEIFTDIRTPPRIKQMMKKNEHKQYNIENSHPGVAEPLDENAEPLEESTQKINYYKIETKSTTDSGLSTWILLSGQAISSTAKPFKNSFKPLNNEATRNVTMITNPSRIVKPLFKKRPTITTEKASSMSTTQSSKMKVTVPPTTEAPKITESVTKLTKVKASVLNNAIHSKNSTLVTMASLEAKYEKKKDETKMKTTPTTSTTTTEASIKEINSSDLKPELKVGDLELSSASTTTSPKKTRRPTHKKKKDKNRRRRPAIEDKVDNQNKTTKVATKEKPISTQIYNYLAREVMPTVGVGLVGLVVTAGLASYFLYPFGSLRRSYEVDRRDKDNVFYYDNEYSNAVPEEEAIGKVIAGMPLANNEYRPQTLKNPYGGNRYRHVDYSKPQASIESVQLDSLRDYKNDNYLQDQYPSNEIHKNEPITYNKDMMSKSVEAGYVTSDKQYVVGNVPKEVQEVTPAAVPEHGPRSMNIRKRRNVLNTNMVDGNYNLKGLFDKIKKVKVAQMKNKNKNRLKY